MIRIVVPSAAVNTFTCPHCQFQWDNKQIEIQFPKGIELKSGWNMFLCRQCNNVLPLLVKNSTSIQPFKIVGA